MEDKNIYLSSNLKYLRTQKGVSQRQVGEKLGKTDVAVLYWENGSREPSSVDLYNLSQYYNVNIDDLVTKDLRLEENVVLDDTHKVDKIIMDNLKTLTDEDKKKIIAIMDVIKGSDNIS